MIITVFIFINLSIRVTSEGDYENLRGNQTTQSPFNNRTSESFSVSSNAVTGSSQTPASTRGQSSNVTPRPGSFSSVGTETAPYSSTTWPSTTWTSTPWPSTTWPSAYPETSTQARLSSSTPSRFSTDPEGSYTSSRSTYVPPNSVAEEWTVSRSPPYTTVISSSQTPTFRPESTPPTRAVTFASNPPPTTEDIEPGKGSRGGSQGDEGTILYDSLDHWLTEFHFKLSEQRSNIYNTRIESDFDDNKYRARLRAESLLRIISVNYENAKRFVIARQDVHSVNSLRQQESRFCQYGYTYWPLSTRTLKCGTGYLMGNCCTVESRSCFSAPPNSVFRYPRNETDEVSFPSENEY